jgi:hypothetical protein
MNNWSFSLNEKCRFLFLLSSSITYALSRLRRWCYVVVPLGSLGFDGNDGQLRHIVMRIPGKGKKLWDQQDGVPVNVFWRAEVAVKNCGIL